MHAYRTEGIIIKRKNFGEADRIITVFTKYSGKIQVMAKGVRKITSRRSSHVELLNLSLLTLHVAKMPILTEAETLNHFSLLKNDLKRAGYAFYVCELIDGMLAEHQENRSVFSLIQNTLFNLETTNEPKALLNKFEQELLSLLGFWPREQAFALDSSGIIENIMERKIKTKRMLPFFF